MPHLVEAGRKTEQVWPVVGLVSHQGSNFGVEVSGVFVARTPESSLRANGRWAGLETTHGLHDDPDGPYVAVKIEPRRFWRGPVAIVAQVWTVPVFVVLTDGLAEVAENDVWEFGTIVGAEEDIRRLDVAMHDSLPMRVFPSLGRKNRVVNTMVAVCHCICQLNEEFPHSPLFRRLIVSPPSLQSIGQCSQIAILHVNASPRFVTRLVDEGIDVLRDVLVVEFS